MTEERNHAVTRVKEVWKELNDVTLADKCKEMLKTNANGCARGREELLIDLGCVAVKQTFSAPGRPTSNLRATKADQPAD